MKFLIQNKRMKHKCKITILKRECYKDLQAKYLADPNRGLAPIFMKGRKSWWTATISSVC